MPTFSYKAITPTGAAKEGVLEAASEAQVLESLHAQGLIPVKIQAGRAGNTATEATAKKPRRLFGAQKIKAEDIMALTQQMSTMLRAGLPLDRALGILLEISDKPAVQTLVQGIQTQVRSGKRFADALEESGKFSRFYINMVRAGEAGGSVDLSRYSRVCSSGVDYRVIDLCCAAIRANVLGHGGRVAHDYAHCDGNSRYIKKLLVGGIGWFFIDSIDGAIRFDQ